MWSDENIEILKKLHTEGLSFSAIAARVGASKNSVAGKVDRLVKQGALSRRIDDIRARALQGKLAATARRAERAHRASERQEAARQREAAKRAQRPSMGLTEPTQDLRRLIALPTKDFMSRKPGICKWPHDDCDERATRWSYCDEHHVRSRCQTRTI